MGYKQIIIFFLITFTLSCQNKKKEAIYIVPNLTQQKIDSVPISNKEEIMLDDDDIFAAKIMTCIIKQYEDSYRNHFFEKQNWKIAELLDSTNKEIIPFLLKETHYLEIESFGLAFDYYKFSNTAKASDAAERYKKQWTWSNDKDSEERFQRNSIKPDSLNYINKDELTTYVYQSDSLLYFLRFGVGRKFQIKEVLENIISKDTILNGTYTSLSLVKSKWQVQRESLPFIDKNLAKEIAPKMKRWLSAYKLDINKFRFTGTREFTDSYNSRDKESLYYCPFDPDEGNQNLPLLDYSPNRRLYISLLPSLGAYLENDTLKYYGGDDCQSIYLTDIDNKTNTLILWLGALALMYDCFWLDNNRFILVGYSNEWISIDDWFRLYDLSKGTVSDYIFDSTYIVREDIEYTCQYNLKARGYPVLCD